MKHLLTKTNGSSVYKTQGAAKQAANRFLKANQGDYRMDIQQVEGGFEVTMVELVELSKIKELKEDNARLQEEVKRGNKALVALETIVSSYHQHDMAQLAPDCVKPNNSNSQDQLSNADFDRLYVVNELVYGLAMEITRGINPLDTLNDLVDSNYIQVQKDDDGYISAKFPNSDISISEFTYAKRANDLLIDKMKEYAKLQPEKLVSPDNIQYGSNHHRVLDAKNALNNQISVDGIF